MRNRFTFSLENRSTSKSRLAFPTACDGAQNLGLLLRVGFAFAFTILVAPLAGAEELQQIAQATSPATPASGSTPPSKPKPAPNTGIEEIIVSGSESEATGDFETADSVTGFGSEDLAALGAQDIADIAAFTPNLEIVTSGATTPTFFIRGVGLNDFNSNSTGAVAIYQDDVARNAPALQLSTLFDIEAVNVLRGPQGTGLARNASAGAIKIYSRKPTGELSAFLRTELGNFNSRDFEGALESPIYKDILAGRFAFRFSERDGIMKNRCGDAPAFADRVATPSVPDLRAMGKSQLDTPWSICSEPVLSGNISTMPTGLASRVNDIGNWAARGTLLFQPTLDMTWLINGHGSRRDEYSRLGQAYGIRGGNGFTCLNGDIDNCYPGNRLFPNGSRSLGTLGGVQDQGYQAPEVRARLAELAPCFQGISSCNRPENRTSKTNDAKLQVAEELANDLDSEPWVGDFNRTGKTTNDTWGTYLKGDIVLPWGLQLTSVTGYDTYDRIIDTDLDFSPQTLFQLLTDDDGWQVTSDLRLQGVVGDEALLRWDIGGWFMREQLDVFVNTDLGNLGGVSREYTQDLWSAAGYATVAFDFWEKFTLDGGFRYNWERKTLDYALFHPDFNIPFETELDESWTAPTGTARLTYRFRDDTHAYWKYTRGWKPGTYNATGALLKDFATNNTFANVSIAEPESIDSFETGVRGSWFEGRFGLDLSVFYYSYSDYQIFIAQQFEGGNPEFVILNAEDAEVYGAELDAVIRPWTGAFANVRFGWLESQFLDFVQVQQDKVQGPTGQVTIARELQNTGNNLLNSPRFKVSLTGEQTLQLGRYGSITARYDGVWTDVTYFDAAEGRGIPNNQNLTYLPENTIGQRDFWIHNVLLSYRPPGGWFELTGFVRNVTNQAYKTFAFDGATFRDTTIFFVGDPRTYGGSLNIRF